MGSLLNNSVQSAQDGPKVVRALPASECNEVRTLLEQGVPIGPGFRRMLFEFPPNDLGISGGLCRLQTVGSGAYMESQNITTLADMSAYVKTSLMQGGWRPTQETEEFRDTSQVGKDVFALYKNNAICVSSIQIGVVEGYIPDTSVKEEGRIFLGALFPYERDWWIAVDCFTL